MRATKFNEEVLITTDDVVKVDANDIEELKQKARLNPRKRVRLCAHKDLNEIIHEMLIVHEKSCYVRPHKHINKTETFHIIEGEADILLFDEKGHIDQTNPMGSYNSGRKFFYRLPPFRYHTLVIHSDVLVFHEITKGPFKLEDTICASWAPDENDLDAVSRYMAKLSNIIQK